jgi:hypothetical protein
VRGLLDEGDPVIEINGIPIERQGDTVHAYPPDDSDRVLDALSRYRAHLDRFYPEATLEVHEPPDPKEIR